MPEDKLSNIDRFSTKPLSSKGGAALLNSDAETTDATLVSLSNRYQSVQELVGQLSKAQGRLPTEVDQKLQALLQQLNIERQSLSDRITEQQPGKTETTTIAQPNTEQQQSLRQLSTMLSQTPITSLPTVLKTDVGTRISGDALYSTLIKLMQQQPATLGPDTALGKNILNYLLQSQLALTQNHWQNLPLPLKSQLTQSGILPPTALASPPQRQLIQQITSQIFSLLAQPKSTPTISTTPLPVNSGQTTVAPGELNTTSNDVQQQTTLQGSTSNLRNIDLVLKTFLQSLPQETAPLPQPVKELVQQLQSLLQQPITNSSNNESLQTTLPNRLQPVINNPLLNEINNQPATTISVNRIQNTLNTLNTQTASENTTRDITNNPTLSIDSKTADILNRWLLQLAAPKIMQSPELLTQIKTMSPMPIWLPATTDEWHQYQNSFESLQETTLQLVQQLQAAVSTTTSPMSANDASSKTADDIQNENSILPIQAISRNDKGNNIAVLQQLLTSLQHGLPRLGASATETLPVSLSSAAELLLQQFSSPLQTSDHVRSWMQFLLQPLDSDGAYGKAMQQWLVQLLQLRAKTNQAAQQTKSNSTEQNHLQNQLNALDKLSEQSVESFRMPPQPTPGSNGQLPSFLHFPLPPQNIGEEPGSLTLQRNTREDDERGWSISLSLEPGKLGPIRFQARIALPEITLSIVAEKTATVDLIKQTYPLLEQRFQSLGLTPQTLQIRQGKIKKETSISPDPSSRFSVKV
ncbi:MAG: flagellar hook-length control protein FliK [Tolumonas sp.]|nr:flagellar hook-length control protein FliK [Tolumonas sp.]